MAATSGTTVFENKQEQLPQPKKPKHKVLLDERGLLDLPFLALTVLLVLIGVIMLLVPGIPFTNAIRDILLGDIISGSLRLVEAVLLAAMLALGMMAAIWLMGGAA